MPAPRSRSWTLLNGKETTARLEVGNFLLTADIFGAIDYPIGTEVKLGFNGIHIMQRGDVLNQDFIKKNQVSTLLIAIPSIKLSYKQEITNEALDLGLNVKSVPHISKWINASFTVSQIQDIKIEDLLERESIKLDNVNIVRQVVDKVVMVTGAAGSIGSEICRQLTQYQPAKIIMVDQAESPMYDLQFELRNTEPYNKIVDRMVFVIANIKDKPRMEQVFAEYHPQVIYHAAAYKHVPFMEENPYERIPTKPFLSTSSAQRTLPTLPCNTTPRSSS